MTQRVPQHPTENPRLDDDTYSATILHAIEGTYGQDEQFVQIQFWLPEKETALVTNFYFARGRSWKVQRRFWIMCKIIGLEPCDLAYEPELFEGRKLRIITRRVDPRVSKVARWYSDVDRFLPPA